MPRQILPIFVTAGVVDDLKKRLRAAAVGTDQTVQSCAPLNDATRASWGQFYAAVLDFTGEPTAFWTANAANERAYAYEDELVSWQGKLKGGGCALTVPDYDPSKNKAQDATLQLFEYLAIIAAAVGGAYVVSRVIEVLPKPTQTIEVKKSEGDGGGKAREALSRGARTRPPQVYSVGYEDRRGRFHVVRVRAGSKARAILAARKKGHDIGSVRFTSLVKGA